MLGAVDPAECDAEPGDPGWRACLNRQVKQGAITPGWEGEEETRIRIGAVVPRDRAAEPMESLSGQHAKPGDIVEL